MPSVREHARRIHAVDEPLEREVLVSGMRDAALDRLPYLERPFERALEPGPEFLAVRDRPPDALARGLELDPLLDSIGVHHVVHCATSELHFSHVRQTCNRFVARKEKLCGPGEAERDQPELEDAVHAWTTIERRRNRQPRRRFAQFPRAAARF
jgi:hypothetical protein